MRREGIRETRSKECTDWGSQTTEQVNKAGNHPKRGGSRQTSAQMTGDAREGRNERRGNEQLKGKLVEGREQQQEREKAARAEQRYLAIAGDG